MVNKFKKPAREIGMPKFDIGQTVVVKQHGYNEKATIVGRAATPRGWKYRVILIDNLTEVYVSQSYIRLYVW